MSEVYNIGNIENNGNKLISIVSIDKNHKVFEGHFPERSILPGVLQLEILKNVLSKFFKTTFKLKLVKNAKYMALILPDEISQFTVEIDYDTTEEGVKAKAIIKDDDKVYLKFSGVFVENE